MNQNQSPLDPYRKKIEELLPTKNYQEIADLLPITTSRHSIRRALKRWGITKPGVGEQPGITVKGDEAEITSRVSTGFSSPEDLIIERGLKTDDWEVGSLTVNEWDSPTGDILRQLKCQLKRKKPIQMVMPARVDGKQFKYAIKRKQKDKPTKHVLCGDQQAPYHNLNLHKKFLQFLNWYDPDRGVLIGDTIDLPDISRHPHNPEWHVTTQQCIDAGYSCLYDYREANENVGWVKLAGNHDQRLRRAIIDRLREVYGIRRGKLPDEVEGNPVLDVAFLLRLDELGIEYVKPSGDYEHMQVQLSPYLAARHGWIARKGSGASALATLEQLGYSVIVGHTHRQSLVHKTRHDINEGLTTLVGCETGCMCAIEGGLSYAVAPDWQNGFATAEIWPDGTFKVDLATYVDGHLYYRDQRF